MVSLTTTLWASFLFFFFNDTATTEIYTLSLHDALPISLLVMDRSALVLTVSVSLVLLLPPLGSLVSLLTEARLSSRLHTSHYLTSYAAVFLMLAPAAPLPTAALKSPPVPGVTGP